MSRARQRKRRSYPLRSAPPPLARSRSGRKDAPPRQPVTVRKDGTVRTYPADYWDWMRKADSFSRKFVDQQERSAAQVAHRLQVPVAEADCLLMATFAREQGISHVDAMAFLYQLRAHVKALDARRLEEDRKIWNEA